jgi:hypothetical protein
MIKLALYFARGVAITLFVAMLICMVALVTDGHGIWTGATP